MDARGDAFGAFSDRLFVVAVDGVSCRDLQEKKKVARHESGVPCSSADITLWML